MWELVVYEGWCLCIHACVWIWAHVYAIHLVCVCNITFACINMCIRIYANTGLWVEILHLNIFCRAPCVTCTTHTHTHTRYMVCLSVRLHCACVSMLIHASIHFHKEYKWSACTHTCIQTYVNTWTYECNVPMSVPKYVACIFTQHKMRTKGSTTWGLVLWMYYASSKPHRLAVCMLSAHLTKETFLPSGNNFWESS